MNTTIEICARIGDDDTSTKQKGCTYIPRGFKYKNICIGNTTNGILCIYNDKINYARVDEFIRFHGAIVECGITPFLLKLEHNSKDPMPGFSWKRGVDLQGAIDHMSNGGNVGIAGTTRDTLVIMDKDDPVAVGESKPTLTCTSRTRTGSHHYYTTQDPLATSIYDDSAKQNIATDNCGEIRAVWQYVVAPGSWVPVTQSEYDDIPDDDKCNAGRYSMVDARAISNITFSEIPKAYTNSLMMKRNADSAKSDKMKIKKNMPRQSKCAHSAIYDITIRDVITHNIRDGKRFASPFHGSTTEKNTSVTGDLVQCWRHNVTQTPLTALAILAGIGSCNVMGYGHNGMGSSGLDLDDGETLFIMWKYAKDNGIIPINDPIPTQALIHYALSNKICKQCDIENGWRISNYFYDIVIANLTHDGIQHGRNVKHSSRCK